jgi:hypothetical protein
MRLRGYVPRVYRTEIGAYTVWSRVVDGTKPVVVFPGFGLGAVPYARVVLEFGRTVHIVECPNLGYHTGRSPAYITPESVYRVVRTHLAGEAHDIVAHSLGTSQAAFYVNRQYEMGTEDPGQVVVLCDSFVSPVDSIVSHLYPFTSRSMYDEVARPRGAGQWAFSCAVWFLVSNLDCTVYTKRFHTFYDGTFWRSDYRSRLCYVYGERDLLFDVPHIRQSVSGPESNQYLFLPKARHGSCLFGRRRAETLDHISRWMDGMR